jgi:hypothetical protein
MSGKRQQCPKCKRRISIKRHNWQAHQAKHQREERPKVYGKT